MPTLHTYIAASADDAYHRGNGQKSYTNSDVYIWSYTSDTSNQYFAGGFRFQLNIAKDATINRAYLRLHTSGAAGEDDPNFVLYGNDVDNADDFSTNSDILNRVRTTASASYVITNAADYDIVEVDVTSIVQEIVNRASWSSGNYIALLAISNTDQALKYRVRAYDFAPSEAAELYVEYGGDVTGDALWTHLTGLQKSGLTTDIFLHRISADNYDIYYQIWDSPRHWVVANMSRPASATEPLDLRGLKITRPDTASDFDDPETWTSETTIVDLLETTSATIYAWNIDGAFRGFQHTYNDYNTEGWEVDDVDPTLGNDEWASGSKVEYIVDADLNDDGGTVANVDFTITVQDTARYVNSAVTFTWSATQPVTTGYIGMLQWDAAQLPTVNFELAGTDYTVTHTGSASTGQVPTRACALWDTNDEYLIGMAATQASLNYFKWNEDYILYDDSQSSPNAKMYFPVVRNGDTPDRVATDTDTWVFNWIVLTQTGTGELENRSIAAAEPSPDITEPKVIRRQVHIGMFDI